MSATSSDPTYSPLEKSLHLLREGKAKVDFLYNKVEERLTEMENEEVAQVAQRTAVKGEPLALNQSAKWRLTKEKAVSLLRSLDSCREKCVAVQGTLQRLIEVKDSLLAQSINSEETCYQKELLPEGTRVERMVLELSMERSECSICTETMKKTQSIWSCKACFNIFHLDCAGKCMDATKSNSCWYCPCCRTAMPVVADGLRYTCFCGRLMRPTLIPNETPHSCGRICSKGCGMKCHPGPCINQKSTE